MYFMHEYLWFQYEVWGCEIGTYWQLYLSCLGTKSADFSSFLQNWGKSQLWRTKIVTSFCQLTSLKSADISCQNFCSPNLIFTSILQESRKISWFGPQTAELKQPRGVILATSHFISDTEILMHKMHQLPRFGWIRSADASAAATFAELQIPRHFGSLFKDHATYLVQFFARLSYILSSIWSPNMSIFWWIVSEESTM